MKSNSTFAPPWRALALISLATVLFTGCAGPIAHCSHIMQKAPAAVTKPPSDKALVLIHRPRAYQGYALYTGVWDSKQFIADLGNGHSVAYECEPGTHYFINRSVERVGVIEAKLLPAQTYDLRLETAGAFIASFQIEPIKHDDRESKEVPKWEKENLWVTRAPAAAAHEQERQKEIELIINDFVSGEKKNRVRHLGPDDHR